MAQSKRLKTSKMWHKEDSDTRWNSMMRYYMWFFMFFFLLCAVVLFCELLIVPALCMLVFCWYVAPLKAARKYDEKLGRGKRILLFVALAVLAASFVPLTM